MKKSSRIFVLAFGVEVLLGVVMMFLLYSVGQSSPETATRIGTSLGGVMGALGLFLALWGIFLRRSGS